MRQFLFLLSLRAPRTSYAFNLSPLDDDILIIYKLYVQQTAIQKGNGRKQKNDKRKIYTIAFIPPNWMNKNNSYTQTLPASKNKHED